MPIEHALVIAKQGQTDDVDALDPKDRAFDSRFPCLKIFDAGKYTFTASNGSSPVYTISLNSVLAFPVDLIVFLYDPSDSSYKAIGSENILDHTQNYRGSFSFDEDELFVTVENYTGADVSSHLIYIAGYA